MPYYVLLSTLTNEGLKTVRERPERIREVNKELEGFHVHVIAQYALLGPYDFLSIIEAPDNAAVARMSAELGSRGTVKIMTMAAIPTEEFITSVKKRTKRLVVDQDRCTGDQVCVTIAPYVFNMNPEGKAYVVDPKGADDETIEYAIRQCPSLAILWVEEE